MKQAYALGLWMGLALGAAGALVMGCAPRWDPAELLLTLEQAEAGGDWGGALTACLGHPEIARGGGGHSRRCGRAAEHLAGSMGGALEVSEASVALRALADWGDRSLLAEALDRSRVVVPAGEFIMGSDTGRTNERPEHWVYLDEYAINRFEVTNVQYARFVDATGRGTPLYWVQGSYPEGQDDLAVVGVKWEQAEAYCEWTGGRLPTEAEWEKACRGAAGTIYPWGDAWDESRANIGFGHERATGAFLTALYPTLQAGPAAGNVGLRPVGSFPHGASSSGVLDLVGNAAEWVADWYNWDGYWTIPAINPIGEGPEWNRSVRGSSWFFPMGMEDEAPLWSRCSARNSSHASIDPRVGFRCAYPTP